MNQLARRPLPHMTATEFLAWPGDGSGRRFQLVDGEIRPMSPASRVHGVIQANLAFLLISAVRVAALPLQVLAEGAIIPATGANGDVKVPDLVVAPGDDRRGDQAVAEPVAVIEVLSPGNSDDTRDNIRAYATLASVREIAVIHTGEILAEVHRRAATGAWEPGPELISRGQVLRLASVSLECPVRRRTQIRG